MNEPILSKQAFFRLWCEGLLGNKPNTWKTVDEFMRSGFSFACR